MSKIAIHLPPDSHLLTHGGRMVCMELLHSLADEDENLEIELIVPEAFASTLDGFTYLKVLGFEGPWQTLRFEQLELPRCLRSSGADLLLMLYRAAPLGSSVPVALLEVLGQAEPMQGIGGRLLQAARAAGVQGARAHVAYSDMRPTNSPARELQKIDPWVHPDFRALSEAEDRHVATTHGLPYSYVIAHGISPLDVQALLASWTWVDGSVGDTVPLAVLVSEGREREIWERGVERMNLGHSVSLLKGVQFNELPAIYRRAEAMLQGAHAVQHQLLRWALACGVPVTGFETTAAADVLGSAGYLVNPGDSRALGAACLTVIVEPEVRDRLRKEGLVRASAFHTHSGPAERLSGLIRNLADG